MQESDTEAVRSRFTFPCFVATPQRSLVTTPEAFRNAIRVFNGRTPVYATHNGWKDATTVYHSRIPFDMDAKEFTLEDTMRDALAILQWGRSHDVPVLTNFSGARGFHSYLTFRQSEIENNVALKATYSAWQRTVERDAGLRTMDQHLVGDTQRVMRVPNTIHESSRLWCVTVPDEMLERGDVGEVLAWAKTKRPAPDVDGLETLWEATMRLSIKPEARRFGGSDTPTIRYDGATAPALVRDLLPRPCVHQGLMSANPPHTIRREAANQLVLLGYDVPWITRLLVGVGEKAGWIDLDENVTAYHVAHLAKNRGRYSPTSCEKIRGEGLCVGPSCPFYSMVFGETAND